MGVSLCCRHPGVAKHLLHDADVDALLDQQRGGGVPGVMDASVPDLSLAQDGLPRPPILGALDRAAAPGGEHQVVVGPRATRPQPLRGLPLAVLAQQLQERGWALEGELALALALPGDDAAANAVRAFGGMASAIRRAGALVTNVALLRTSRFAGRKVLVLLALRSAWPPVPLLTTCVRVVATVPPLDALNLEPGPDDASLQVHIRPAKTQGLALADTEREGDRPASAVRLVAATSRTRRASSRVSGSISCVAAEGASTKTATFRVIRPRRTAILSARESTRRRSPAGPPAPEPCG